MGACQLLRRWSVPEAAGLVVMHGRGGGGLHSKVCGHTSITKTIARIREPLAFPNSAEMHS